MMVPPDFLIGFQVDIFNINLKLYTKKQNLAEGVNIRYWLYLNRDLHVPNSDDQVLFGRRGRYSFAHFDHIFIYSESIRRNSVDAYFKWRIKPEMSKSWSKDDDQYIFSIPS